MLKIKCSLSFTHVKIACFSNAVWTYWFTCLRITSGFTVYKRPGDVRTSIERLYPVGNLSRFLRLCSAPKHLNSPFTKMPARVHVASTSSILWDVMMTDPPAWRAFTTALHKIRLLTGSNPELGSSSFKEQRPSYKIFFKKIIRLYCSEPK